MFHYPEVISADPRYHDLGVVGWYGILFIGQEFFLDLFTGSEARKYDLYILSQCKPCELDHLLGEVNYLHGITHVEDIDLSSFAHITGFQHELACLGNGHEVPRNIRVGYRDRPTFL